MKAPECSVTVRNLHCTALQLSFELFLGTSTCGQDSIVDLQSFRNLQELYESMDTPADGVGVHLAKDKYRATQEQDSMCATTAYKCINATVRVPQQGCTQPGTRWKP